ncbi:MAG: hypothetical protein WCD23_14665, partial [Candidatus Acidiferrales bacterium]
MAEPNSWPIILFADVGTQEPFMARITSGLRDVLDATRHRNKPQIAEAICALCLDCLIPAFISLRELRATAAGKRVPEITKITNFEGMYKNLWTAYKDRMQIAAGLMGYEIGFLFQKNSGFERGCVEFPTANPEVTA